VDTDTGEIVFTPVGTFTGSSSIVYEVADQIGRTAHAMLTVTLAPFTVTGGTRTIRVNQTAQVQVTGVPAHSTVTAPETVGGAAVTVAGTVVEVDPPADQSGVFTVPVTVTHGTASVSVQVLVNVVPAAATDGWYGLLDSARTAVRWSAVPGAAGYQVIANGHQMCITTGLACTINDLLGPRARITVTVLGADGLRADPVRVGYRTGDCRALASVYFNPDSAALSRFSVSTLNDYLRLLAVQGFRNICLAGHTDSLGSQAYNLALSKRRVTSAGNYIGARIHGLAVTRSYRGEDDPSSSNGTPQGQALNRRVDLGIR
jgi:outer membrane protein OmpA-like peptidoglycan-associated protein